MKILVMLTITLKQRNNLYYFIFNIGNDEGDGEFMDPEDDDNWDLNYDIDETWFTGSQAKILKLFTQDHKHNQLRNREYQIGAGRNG